MVHELYGEVKDSSSFVYLIVNDDCQVHNQVNEVLQVLTLSSMTPVRQHRIVFHNCRGVHVLSFDKFRMASEDRSGLYGH